MLFSFWILKILIQYEEAISPSFLVLCNILKICHAWILLTSLEGISLTQDAILTSIAKGI